MMSALTLFVQFHVVLLNSGHKP